MPNRAFYAGPPTNCDYLNAELWRLEAPVSFFSGPVVSHVVTGTVPPSTHCPRARLAIDACLSTGERVGEFRPECPGLSADLPFEQLFAYYGLVPVRGLRQLEFDLPERQVL